MTNKQEYGDRIRLAREMKGWSCQELANHASLTKAYLIRLEHSRTNPSLKVIKQIATALDISPAWIAFGKFC